MVLTDIAIRRKGLYALSFDRLPLIEWAQYEKENVLLINRDTFDLKGYKAGSRLEESDIEELVFQSFCDSAYSKGLWLLNFSDCTAKAMKDKLKKDYPEFACDYAVARLLEMHIIDDERYAKRCAELLIKDKNLPSRQAVYKLIEKGVPRDIAQNVVDEVPVDADEQLEKIIQKKYILRLSNPNEIKKVTAALMRKGFSFYDIKAAIEKHIDFDLYKGED